jgi:tetratricopeptide (TPR) repeat protein
MNKYQHNDHLFTECLSEEHMLDYIDNKLTPQQRNRVEKHVLDCEICSDALEGYALISDRSKLDDAAFAVNTLVLENKEEKEEKRGWWGTRMKIAASIAVLLLLGSIALYIKNSIEKQADQTFAQHFEPFPAAPAKEIDKENASAENTGKKDEAKEIAQTGTGIESLVQQENSEEQPLLKTNENTLASKMEADEPLAPTEMSYSKSAPKVVSADEEISVRPDMDVAKDERIVMADDNSTLTGNNNTSNNTNSKAPVSAYYQSADSVKVFANMTPTQTQGTQALTYTPSDAGNKFSELSKNISAKEVFAQSTKKKSRSNNIESAPASETKVNDELAIVDTKAKEKKNTSTVPTTTAADKTVDNTSIAKLEEQQKQAGPSKAAFDKAMEKYNAGKYSEALVFFEQALAAEPLNTEALFYSAISYLGINQPDKAISNLDKVIAQNASAYTSPATWYKSLAYIKKGDKKNARVLLEQLQKGNSSYKQKAADTLKDL